MNNRVLTTVQEQDGVQGILSETPLVSIIINNYNYGRFLGEAIESALNQTYPHTEVIVVDDGSTDHSRDVISQYGDRIIPLLKENGGQASAFNVGFAASHGEIICFLDSDDMFQPDKVEKLVATFKAHPQIRWCFHPLRYLDNHTKASLDRYPEGISSRQIDLRSELQQGKIPLFPPATSGLAFTRSLLAKVLPMPQAIICISDNYLKYTTLSFSPGFLLDEDLAILRVHGNNVFTKRPDKQRLEAKIHVLIAEGIRANFPKLKKLANKLMGIHLGTYWRTGGVAPESQAVVNRYLTNVSLIEKLEIYLRAAYHSGSLFSNFRKLRIASFQSRVKQGEIL
ncbi:MAG: glycosyltransferase [Leptolyngbyaceae cyanobacterium bins.59]|nr:glycosyltransferase [Leptolyngbyaceae cyanobacterium bins.59]